MDFDRSEIASALSKAAPVLVIGDIMLDQYLVGKVGSCPEGGEKFVVCGTKNVLGGAGNVATNLRALGVKVHLISAVGTYDRKIDDAGRIILALLDEAGIKENDRHLINSMHHTTVKARMYDDEKRVSMRVDRDLLLENPQEVVAVVNNYLNECPAPVVIVSDYAKGVVSQELIRLLASSKATVFVDPKPKNNVKYTANGFPFVLRPNKAEASEIAGFKVDEEHLARVLQSHGARNVIITLGKEGMIVLDEKGTLTRMPALASAVDVTGAGDTVIAGLAAFHSIGLPLRTCCELASVAAAVVIQKSGTATATIDEIDALRQNVKI
ncbi:hypothetical protein HY486_04255 [Candidatus Woesearchaeota archaeon]|nr:hypothetical protein [Candidatus Woesearchaeota archaeon]